MPLAVFGVRKHLGRARSLFSSFKPALPAVHAAHSAIRPQNGTMPPKPGRALSGLSGERHTSNVAKGMNATEAHVKARYKRYDGSEVTKEKTKQQVRS